MELSQVILGQIVTEKSERLKATDRTYTLRVAPSATKIEVARALEKFFDVDVTSVRMQWLRPKARYVSASRILTKRHRSKRAIVTLDEKSKTLDLSTFKVS